MKETIELINHCSQAEPSVSTRSAVPIGATFYLEPLATGGPRRFRWFSPTLPGHALVTLAPIYEYLRGQGCIVEGEHIVAGGWPVQFLPASTPLLIEARIGRCWSTLDGVPTRGHERGAFSGHRTQHRPRQRQRKNRPIYRAARLERTAPGRNSEKARIGDEMEEIPTTLPRPVLTPPPGGSGNGNSPSRRK